jgi:hypothetical protein
MLSLFKRFPIKVVLFKRYGNALKLAFDQARYEKRRIKTIDGIIENNYLLLKKEKVKIPPPPIDVYYDIDNTRHLYLLQIDRDTFYPLSFDAGKINVNVPTYVFDGEGNVIKDEKGNPKITYVERPIFDSNIILEDGRLISLPSIIANKTYDKEHWLSNEIETASRLYRSKAFWERYGNFIILAVVGILLVMFFYIGVSKYTDLTKTLVDGLKEVAQNINVASDKLAQAVKETAKQPISNITSPPF